MSPRCEIAAGMNLGVTARVAAAATAAAAATTSRCWENLGAGAGAVIWAPPPRHGLLPPPSNLCGIDPHRHHHRWICVG